MGGEEVIFLLFVNVNLLIFLFCSLLVLIGIFIGIFSVVVGGGGGVLFLLLDEVFFLMFKFCGRFLFCGGVLLEYMDDMLSCKFRCEWVVGMVMGKWVMGGFWFGNENIFLVDEDIWWVRGDVWSILVVVGLKVEWGEGEVGNDWFVGEGDNEYREEGDIDDFGVRCLLDVVVGRWWDGDEVFCFVGDDDSVWLREEGGKGLGDVMVGDRLIGDGMVSLFV